MTVPAVDLFATPTARVRTDLDWLPEKYRKRGKRIRIRFRTVPGERRLFKKRKKIQPSVWAPRNRRITYGPLQGSFYDPGFVPHMNGIIDTFSLPFIKELGNCKAPQTGSSAGAETCLAWLGDMDPGDTLIVYPDRDTSGKRGKDYLKPMFEGSPRLRSLMTGLTDDVAAFRIKLQTMLIYMGWAHSVTSLSNVSVRYLFLDEIDKYPEQAAKKEAATIELAKERVRAYLKFGGKIWYNSTPTGTSGPITEFIERAKAVFDYFPRCPDCGTLQPFHHENVVFPKDERDPERIKEEKLARYVCDNCGVEWDDRKRDMGLIKGEWFARLPNWKAEAEAGREWGHDPRPRLEYLLAVRPETVCFHSPGLVSPLVSISEYAYWFLRGSRSKLDMRYFMNQIKAEAFQDYEVQRREDEILKLKDDRPEGLVPSGNVVAGLFAGGDTQDHYLSYDIYAFGWGLEQAVWHIKGGEATTWAALREIIFEFEYKDADGLVYPVQLLVQDAMGHRTAEVYDFVRTMPGRAVAYKGAPGRRPRPFSQTIVDRYPGTNRPIPGGVPLYTCDTHHYKDVVAAKLRVNQQDPGAFYLHAEATEEFARHMCVEYVDERGLWQQPKGKRQEHWDNTCMAFIAADIAQVKFRKKIERKSAERKREKTATVNPFTSGRQLFGGARQ